MTRLANAPCSYGAFELTVGVLPNVPDAGRVLAGIADAGYAGTELGPLGYLGDEATLRGRLEARGLELVAGFVQMRFGEDDVTVLDESLDLLAAFGARPVLCDGGPRDSDVDLDGVARAVDHVRGRGLDPVYHHHMGTRVETPAEIERLLEGSDVALVLDSGHLTAAGGDPVAALRDWRDRIDYLHVKDVDLGVLRSAPDWPTAWRAGAFCELGTGDADLDGFVAELGGYDGWLLVEQDWVPGPDSDPGPQFEAQVRNRRWLAEHGL